MNISSPYRDSYLHNAYAIEQNFQFGPAFQNYSFGQQSRGQFESNDPNQYGFMNT